MPLVKAKRIGHIVLYVRDPEASAKWYCDLLNMQIVARGTEGPALGGLFLTFGENDHDIALFPGQPEASRGQEFEHFAIELDVPHGDVARLRQIQAMFTEKGVKVWGAVDHGVSIGLYFYDPDGHMLEVFVPLMGNEGGASIAELRRNRAQANPVDLETWPSSTRSET